jgi:hypothetical protein
MRQERRSQISKIMIENFRMLDRIKKSRSHYILNGPKSEDKRQKIAERLADGLIRAPVLLRSIEKNKGKDRSESNLSIDTQSNLNRSSLMFNR